MKTSGIPAERMQNRKEIASLFSTRQTHQDAEDRLVDMLVSSGAILRGHFQLECGLHSQFFFRFSDLAGSLAQAEYIAGLLAADFRRDDTAFDVILVQPSADRVLGQALSELLDKQLVIVRVNEKSKPTGELVNETDLYPNDRVLILEDLATTGSSMTTMIDIVRKRRAQPTALALFATRDKRRMSEFAEKQGIPLYVVGDFAFEKQSVSEAECEMCRNSEPIRSWEI